MANLNPSPATRFQPGHKSNGKPPDKVIAYGKQKIFPGAQSTQADAVVEAAFEKAKQGDRILAPYVLDRLYGKVSQPVEVTHLDGLATRIAEARARTRPKKPILLPEPHESAG